MLKMAESENQDKYNSRTIQFYPQVRPQVDSVTVAYDKVHIGKIAKQKSKQGKRNPESKINMQNRRELPKRSSGCCSQGKKRALTMEKGSYDCI